MDINKHVVVKKGEKENEINISITCIDGSKEIETTLYSLASEEGKIRMDMSGFIESSEYSLFLYLQRIINTKTNKEKGITHVIEQLDNMCFIVHERKDFMDIIDSISELGGSNDEIEIKKGLFFIDLIIDHAEDIKHDLINRIENASEKFLFKITAKGDSHTNWTVIARDEKNAFELLWLKNNEISPGEVNIEKIDMKKSGII